MADGKPLTGGYIIFIPIESIPKPRKDTAPTSEEELPLSPGGKIEEDGSYTISTSGKPGVPPGTYRVVLDRGANRKVFAKVPRKYTLPRQSPLEVEVVENKPEGGYDLKLEPR
jgi:hypothetical protein